MFSVCVCAFFCVCEQVKALRRADHPPKESYRLCMIKKKTEVNGQFHGGRPRPTGAVVPMKKKAEVTAHSDSNIFMYFLYLMYDNIPCVLCSHFYSIL
jgi:hypothetical protein